MTDTDKELEQPPETKTLHIDYRGDGVDELKRRYLLLSVNGTKIPPISVELFGKEAQFFSVLNQAGAHIFTKPKKTAVLKLIEEAKATVSFDVLSRVGWHWDKVFVLPEKIIGDACRQAESALGHLDAQLISKYRQQGTLESWQKEVVGRCTGNSRLVFAVSWAFASAVAALIDSAQKSGGFQIYGPPETGKTTWGTVAGSVWGCHVGQNNDLGFTEKWNTTTNKVEEVMSAHAHVGLILDETSLFDGDFNEVVMRLSEGMGKQRMHQGPPITFEAFFLSTSNAPTWDLVTNAGKRVNEAVLSRICDIPLPVGGHGLFEELHGFADGDKFSKEIKVRSRENFGVAGPAIIEKIVAEISTEDGKAECIKYLRARRGAYQNSLRRKAKAAGFRVLERPADRFASVYAAGCLASKYGILPWKRKDIRKAVLACHLDALRAVQPFLTAAVGPSSPSPSPLSKLVSYIQANRTQFVDLEATPLTLGEEKFGSAKGYRARFKGKKLFYFAVDQLKEIVGGAVEYRSICDVLTAKKLIHRKGKSATVQRPVYVGGKGNKNYAWVVAIRRKVLKVAA